MANVKRLVTYRDYTIAWISALPIERASAIVMLDERHLQPEDFVQPATDTNAYTWGSIAGHNVVITSLSSGVYGTTVAATTAVHMLSSIPTVRFGLLVGIGAGVPRKHADIRLGDIVVSQPSGTNGGVFQYDLGKTGTSWQRKDFLNMPPEALLKSLSNLQAEHEIDDPLFLAFFEDAAMSNTKWGRLYSRPTKASDRLFDTRAEHLSTAHDCSSCNGQIHREERISSISHVHYGTIGSGNSLIKDAELRDNIANMEPNCFCLEMEAAGLMNSFPCIVIRGICDYADSHKNDEWQRYAAAISAAYAKELLYRTPVIAVEGLQPAKEAVNSLATGLTDLNETIQQTYNQGQNDRLHEKVAMLYSCPYAEYKDRNIQVVEGTCKWFLNHDRFCNWLDNKASSLLWTSADPGCGKSVLARHLVDVVLPRSDRIVLYFFFKDDFPDQRNSASAMCAMLHQLFQQAPRLFRESVLTKLSIHGERIKESFSQLWDIFLDIISHIHKEKIVCVIDALDECLENNRSILIESITRLALVGKKNPIKFLLTSRPYDDIRRGFHDIETLMPVIHLSGEGEKEIQEIMKEINIVVVHRVQQLSRRKRLQPDETEYLQEQLTSIPNRTYLWVHLVLDFIEKTPGFSRGHARRSISELPRSVDEAYEKILSRSPNEKAARRLFGFILTAYTPLTVDQVGLLLALDKTRSPLTLTDDLEPTERMQTSIRDICGLFITIVDSKVYLLHQTAREFLVLKNNIAVMTSRLSIGSISSKSSLESIDTWKWRQSIDLKRSHKIFAICCLLLLRWNADKGGKHSLANYTGIYWISHFLESEADSSSSVTSMALNMCQPMARAQWLPCYLEAQNPARSDSIIPPAIPVLSLAIFLNLTPVIQLLMNANSDLNATTEYVAAPLWWAAKSGNTSIVKHLLRAGAKVTGEDLYPRSSPLCEASSQGFDAITRLLLSFNAQVNLPDINGQTAIHRAAAAGHLSTVQILFEGGAYLDYEDAEGNSALLCAAIAGHEQVVELLLNLGAEANARNKYDETSLFAAARRNHEKVVQVLLASGFNANAETKATAFLVSTDLSEEEKDFKCSNEITEEKVMPRSSSKKARIRWHGIDIPVLGEASLTPLFVACLHGHHDTAATLLLHGADPQKHISSRGHTLLHMWKILEKYSIVKLLLDTGAEMHAKLTGDKLLWTPCDIVRCSGTMPVFKLFQEHDYKLDNDHFHREVVDKLKRDFLEEAEW